MANKRGAPGGIISLQGGGIIQESLGAIIPLQTGGFGGIGTLTTSRTLTVRLAPPRLGGGISGSTSAHSWFVRSLG